jgi:UDP-2,3-diacylglucosamine pyrophosphatase LpxH
MQGEENCIRVKGIVASDFHLHASARDPNAAGLRSARDFAHLIDSSLKDGPIELVLCGDIYDLAIAGFAPVGERLRAIAETHLEFHEALRRVMEQGGRVIMVPGNHDYELDSTEARKWLEDAVPGARIEPWFWRVHGAHLEHGSQYDPDNSHPHPLRPEGDPLGILLTRQILHRLGDLKLLHLNDQTPLVLLAHCFVKYGWRTPGLVLRYWYTGLRSWHGLRKRAKMDTRFEAEEAKAKEARFAQARDLPRDEVHALAMMGCAPTHLDEKRLIKRMYLDRMAYGAAAMLATLLTHSVWVLGGFVLGALMLGMYKNLYKGKVNDNLRTAAHRIARHGGAMQVVFGHAHKEHDDGTYLNAGSFAFPDDRSRRAFIEIDLRGARLRHMAVGGDILPADFEPDRTLRHRPKHPLYAYARKKLSRRRAVREPADERIHKRR